jgi:hypothetical protein
MILQTACQCPSTKVGRRDLIVQSPPNGLLYTEGLKAILYDPGACQLKSDSFLACTVPPESVYNAGRLL